MPADCCPWAGGLDAGTVHAGTVHAGPVDAALVDSGPVHAGPVDPGPVNAARGSSPVTRLLHTDPTEVRRAGALLERIDDEADRLSRQLLGQPLPCWSSPSGRDYRAQTEDLAGRVTRSGRAHAQAAAAIRTYARALEEAQDLARHGQRLQAEGERRTDQLARSRTGPDMPVLLGPTPGPPWSGRASTRSPRRSGWSATPPTGLPGTCAASPRRRLGPVWRPGLSGSSTTLSARRSPGSSSCPRPSVRSPAPATPRCPGTTGSGSRRAGPC